MKSFLKGILLVFKELTLPGAQKNDWFLWATVQTGHAMIGMVLAGGLLFVLPPIWAWLIAVVGYTLVKEVPDANRILSWAGARDSAQDALFVGAGAVLAISIGGMHQWLFTGTLFVLVVGLALGIWSRIKDTLI